MGLYWTEQHRERAGVDYPHRNELLGRAEQHTETLDSLLRKSVWTTHAIDTNWSCVHAPLLADLDGDGVLEVIAGKRFQGHEGKDPGENEPLRVMSYQFDRQSRSWKSRVVSRHPLCGLDLDPKCVDIDADGDLDIIGPARSGLVLLENLRINSGTAVPAEQWASYQPPLPGTIVHKRFSIDDGGACRWEVIGRADRFGAGRGCASGADTAADGTSDGAIAGQPSPALHWMCKLYRLRSWKSTRASSCPTHRSQGIEYQPGY